MIEIRNLREVRQDAGYDEVWAIVRYMKHPSPWMKQVPALSPSPELFAEYRRLLNAGQWNAGAFQDVYVPTFLRQLKHDRTALALLDSLYQADLRDNKRIALVCFCPHEDMCHRSIVAGLLQGVGCRVLTASGADYSRYYGMFLAAA